ncbi:hypothetical protein QR98_0059440 [Sarcoptes scabiei]|uniref:Uncharacterized protein n=1 Tax=Sarcoptes scabiei TaxID=52283 RepID=A0A132A9A3_SARSC|nr:hypothetical protein QR98_0059440 [Sarcoptes scabiei]
MLGFDSKGFLSSLRKVFDDETKGLDSNDDSFDGVRTINDRLDLLTSTTSAKDVEELFPYVAVGVVMFLTAVVI